MLSSLTTRIVDIKQNSDKSAMEGESCETGQVNKGPQRWTLETALLLLFFGWYLSVTIMTNQILKQTCLYTFEYNYIICTQLDDKNASIHVEQQIQPYVASILMTVSIFNATIPTVLSLLLGPWSDKYGRKKVLNCIFIGFTLSMGWITIVSYLSEYHSTNNPWNYLFAQLPFMIFGGWPTLIIVVLCYITDQTDESNRSFRFTIVEIIIFGGVLIAMAGSSFLLQLTNPTAVFSISFLCILVGTTIMLFFVDESIHVKNNDRFSTMLKELFLPIRIKELYATCIQPRPFKQRRVLWFLITILMLTHFANNGSNTVFYLFVRQKFGWTLQDLTLYEAATMLMTVGGSAFGLIVLKKIWNFSDLSLSTLSLASLMIDAFIRTFANQSWHLYIASGIALFKLISGPMLRSIMSTIVSRSEISRIYSITSAIEAISGLGAAPLYTATYSATILSFSAAFNLITVGVFVLTLVLALLIAKWIIPMNNKTLDTKL